MQGSSKWAPPGGVLGDLLRSTEARIAALRANRTEQEPSVGESPRMPSFRGALEGETVAVIAEVKRASPSKGAINCALDVASQCKVYEEGGAAAISVLTEPSRFGGNIADLVAARRSTALPLLRKDFVIDELQIAEARAFGASAVLLIVRALEKAKLRDLFRATIENRLDALVEVRSEDELEIALSIGATVIGVNNRDLETLEIDDAAVSLIPRIPRGCIAIAESGYKTAGDISRAAEAGADAVLVGSVLSASLHPGGLLAGMTSIKRSRNARPN